MSLIFLRYNALRNGHVSIKMNKTFKKIYNVPPLPRELLEEMLYSVFPALKLKMKFYISVLQGLAMNGEMVYNVLGGSKFM